MNLRWNSGTLLSELFDFYYTFLESPKSFKCFQYFFFISYLILIRSLVRIHASHTQIFSLTD